MTNTVDQKCVWPLISMTTDHFWLNSKYWVKIETIKPLWAMSRRLGSTWPAQLPGKAKRLMLLESSVMWLQSFCPSVLWCSSQSGPMVMVQSLVKINYTHLMTHLHTVRNGCQLWGLVSILLIVHNINNQNVPNSSWRPLYSVSASILLITSSLSVYQVKNHHFISPWWGLGT